MDRHHDDSKGLTDLLEIESITLVRLLDKMEERGLSERRRHPSDRRMILLFLTEQAHPLLQLRNISSYSDSLIVCVKICSMPAASQSMTRSPVMSTPSTSLQSQQVEATEARKPSPAISPTLSMSALPPLLKALSRPLSHRVRHIGICASAHLPVSAAAIGLAGTWLCLCAWWPGHVDR
ncbi:MarR family transcriptional regulator [Pseudomonas poae]|uniref:MarR family transcriptional regulator n=1 Tax=Pseudomonas poae TaxID=200451 RepID=UPI00223B323A|nr:MarR family transcriptional regulator [Pseudomonas poae]